MTTSKLQIKVENAADWSLVYVDVWWGDDCVDTVEAMPHDLTALRRQVDSLNVPEFDRWRIYSQLEVIEARWWDWLCAEPEGWRLNTPALCLALAIVSITLVLWG